MLIVKFKTLDNYSYNYYLQEIISLKFYNVIKNHAIKTNSQKNQ